MQLYLNKVQRKKNGKGKGQVYNKGLKSVKQSKTNYTSMVETRLQQLEKIVSDMNKDLPAEQKIVLKSVSDVKANKLVGKNFAAHWKEERRKASLAAGQGQKAPHKVVKIKVNEVKEDHRPDDRVM